MGPLQFPGGLAFEEELERDDVDSLLTCTDAAGFFMCPVLLEVDALAAAGLFSPPFGVFLVSLSFSLSSIARSILELASNAVGASGGSSTSGAAWSFFSSVTKGATTSPLSAGPEMGATTSSTSSGLFLSGSAAAGAGKGNGGAGKANGTAFEEAEVWDATGTVSAAAVTGTGSCCWEDCGKICNPEIWKH